jgi:hypothetical protein
MLSIGIKKTIKQHTADMDITGLFTRGVLLNFYFAATNNTNGSNYQIKCVISFKLEIKVSWIDL